MVNPRRPRPTRDTISLLNPVVGRLMAAPRPTLAISIVTAYRFGNMSRPPHPSFPGQRTPRWLMASSRPSGPHNIPLPSSSPQDVPLPASSPTLASTSYATSYASTDSYMSGATILAQATILPGNNMMDEEGESSTAVVDRKNDPRFQSPEAYFGLPLSEIVEGPEYFLHPWHKLMEESTDFPFFIFNAIRYPAKSLNKAAAEAFPWKHVETIRAPWVNDGKLMQYDESLGYCVEQPCDDVSKLDKSKLFGFTHELDADARYGWLQFEHEDTKRYVKYLKDIETKMNAIKARGQELQLENEKIYEELSSLRHKLNRVRGLNVLVGIQRFLAQARVNELEMYQDENNHKLRELLRKYHELMREHHRTVALTLSFDSMQIADIRRADKKRKADNKANEEEQERLMNFIKLQSQKDEEEELKRLHKEAKARAADKGKGKGKGKATAADLNDDDNSDDDDLLADLELAGQPQTLAAAGRMLDPAGEGRDIPQNVPSWFPIFDAQQIVPLRSAHPRQRFDELMVKVAELYSRAEEEKKFGAAKPKPKKIFPELHDPHPEWSTEFKCERGGWWLCSDKEDATRPEKACKPCKAARAEAAREERAKMARGIFPEDEDRTAKEQYDEINQAMDLAMAQAHVEEARVSTRQPA
ncbi:hypothetical protein B0H65DRAFT_478453 [Neurospora tetraspora]|uniref:Uncharacterized protein n=1 Tax=Neurospora tetraspora TaxID=94610 RepID=A0AAE0MMR1_9PEZI|nr:hypothetical protein B0H65DRAFT_478453 [Neurospora tetraspora]